ncbi:hypothetical protein GCM10023161_42380 [Mycobacterium paraffinicum]|uniref:Uncharacterized protein n=1 Tax=Mycobacterium paraffinicum TaxID=53378 RepID=A0ABP8F2Y6_9MYCO
MAITLAGLQKGAAAYTQAYTPSPLERRRVIRADPPRRRAGETLDGKSSRRELGKR